MVRLCDDYGDLWRPLSVNKGRRMEECVSPVYQGRGLWLDLEVESYC